MKKLFHYSILISFILLLSCSVKPKEIKYGEDHCHYCDMTAMDKTHASEYVTKKGKTFVFDAIECMVNNINEENNEDLLEFILVSDYSNPGKLIDARSAGFLISPEIRSPMGANLSAFKSMDEASKMKAKVGGEVYSWNELKAKFRK